MSTKDDLLHEALRLFASRSVDVVGIQEICDAAKVTKPTLYHYFGSKEGLVRAVLDLGLEVLMAALKSLGPYDRDLPFYLERQATLWIKTVQQQPDWFRLELSLAVLGPEHPLTSMVKPLVQILQKSMEDLFSAAGEQHGNMKGRQRLLATGWLGTLNHWTGISLGGWTDTDESFLKAGTRQFLYGVFS